MSVRIDFYFLTTLFVFYNSPIRLDFELMITRTTRYNILSEASLTSSKYCKYVFKQNPVFMQFKINILLISFDTLKVSRFAFMDVVTLFSMWQK